VCLVETWKKMLWWWLVLRQEVGVLRIWDGLGVMLHSFQVCVYILYGSPTGRINNKVLPSHHIYIYIQHTHKSSNPIHSLSHALLLLLLRLASLISAIPCLLETIPVHECAQYTPFAPTSYYHSLISLTTPFYPFSPPPSPPLVLKYKKRRKRTCIASPARRVFCPRGEKADFIMWRKRRIQVEKKVWPSHHTIPSF